MGSSNPTDFLFLVSFYLHNVKEEIVISCHTFLKLETFKLKFVRNIPYKNWFKFAGHLIKGFYPFFTICISIVKLHITLIFDTEKPLKCNINFLSRYDRYSRAM